MATPRWAMGSSRSRGPRAGSYAAGPDQHPVHPAHEAVGAAQPVRYLSDRTGPGDALHDSGLGPVGLGSARRLRNLGERALLGVAHAFTAHAHEPLAVRLGDAARDIREKAPVLLELLGRRILGEQADGVADVLEQAGSKVLDGFES